MTKWPEQDRGGQSGVPIAEAVVLLHGLLRTSSSMRVMERALITSGYRTLNLDYDSRRRSLEALSEEIHPAIEAFCAERSGQVHFVTHSMGGLLARLYLARHRPPRLGRVVMLAPPNEGSPLADLLHRGTMFRMVFGPAGRQLTTRYAAVLRDVCGPAEFEVGIVAGTRSANILSSGLVFHEPNDGKVAVRSTRLDGMADHITIPATHTFMMRNPAAVNATLAFLRNGGFASEQAGSPKGVHPCATRFRSEGDNRVTFASWSLALVGSCSSEDVHPRQQLRAVARAKSGEAGPVICHDVSGAGQSSREHNDHGRSGALDRSRIMSWVFCDACALRIR